MTVYPLPWDKMLACSNNLQYDPYVKMFGDPCSKVLVIQGIK